MDSGASGGKTTGEDSHRIALERMMEAGDRAKSSLDLKEASKMYEEAVRATTSEAARLRSPPRPSSAAAVVVGAAAAAAAMEPSIKLGVCLCELARYQEAEGVLKRCLDEASADDDVDAALHVRALTALANLYQAQSKYDDAIHLHEKAIPIARKMPQSSLILGDHLAGYAETLRKSGHLPEAEQFHREALAIRTRAVEEESCTELKLAVSYTQLGCTLAAMRTHQESYEHHHRALTLRHRYLDFSHGLVSESLNYCAESLCLLGRGCEGVPLALHAVEIRGSVFGARHPARAHALGILALCYFSIGRFGDAKIHLEECLEICEVAFHENHANVIPNLMNYGNVLRSMGDLKGARAAYQRAIAIHGWNFREEGQQYRQLEECKAAMRELGQLGQLGQPGGSHEIDDGCSLASEVTCQVTCPTMSHSSRRGSCSTMSSLPDQSDQSAVDLMRKQIGVQIGGTVTSADIECKGTPVIVFTDIGRDVDDEMALVLLSSLRRKGLLNPIAVITTLSPQKDRAELARGSLDTVGMADVPVGVGGPGGVADGVELEVYEANHAMSSPSICDSGIELACQALESVPPKSAQILCLASLSDVASLIEEHQDLFTSKVKEVVVMGGVMPPQSGDALTPDTAYNNNCDMPSAEFVYEKCQELGVPTATLARWAAYGCPIRPALMDELAKTKHMVAANVRRVSRGGLERLWNKVVRPPDDPGREKLPARCDARWFYKTFCGTDRVPEVLPPSIWTRVEKLNMYDPLAVLICVPSYRELHFRCRTKTVGGVSHAVVGTSESDTGVRDRMSLYREYSQLFVDALQGALHEPEMPQGSEKEPDILVEETNKIRNARNRAA